MTKGSFTRGTWNHLLSLLELLSCDSSGRSRLQTTGISNSPDGPTAMPSKSSEAQSSSLTQEDDAKRGSRFHSNFSSGWEETLSRRHDRVNTSTTVRWNDPWIVATGDLEQRWECHSNYAARRSTQVFTSGAYSSAAAKNPVHLLTSSRVDPFSAYKIIERLKRKFGTGTSRMFL